MWGECEAFFDCLVDPYLRGAQKRRFGIGIGKYVACFCAYNVEPMLKLFLIAIVVLVIGGLMAAVFRSTSANASSPATQPAIPPEIAEKLVPDANNKVHLTQAEWKQILTPEKYHILREGGTECAFDNEFFNNHDPGTYACAGCGQVLFASDHKFDSGTGWPSFFKAVDPKAVETLEDSMMGMRRVEILCSRCGGHLGHIFEDGPKPTGLRYCVDSASLTFIKQSDSPTAQPPH